MKEEDASGTDQRAGRATGRAVKVWWAAQTADPKASKREIGEVVSWASEGAFQYPDIGRLTPADLPKLNFAWCIHGKDR